MLSSFFKHKRGGKNRGNKPGQQGQQGQQGQPSEPKSQTYLPPRFHGQLTKDEHLIVQTPKTFEIPFGVSVKPIFEYIQTNDYTKIEPILKNNFNLNTKLFEGAYVAGVLAIYFGNPKAVRELKTQIVDSFKRVGSDIALGAAGYIESKSQDVFLKQVQSSIDEELENVYGETFDTNADDKANAILSLDMKNWVPILLQKLTEKVSETKTDNAEGNTSSKGKNKRGGDLPTEANTIAEHRKAIQEKILKYDCANADPTKDATVINATKRSVLNYLNKDFNETISYNKDGDKKQGILKDVIFTDYERYEIKKLAIRANNLEKNNAKYEDVYKNLIVPFCDFFQKLDSPTKAKTIAEYRKSIKERILKNDCKNADPTKDPTVINATKRSVLNYLNKDFNKTISYNKDGVNQRGVLKDVIFTDDERIEIEKLAIKAKYLDWYKGTRYEVFYKEIIVPFCDFFQKLDRSSDQAPKPAPEPDKCGYFEEQDNILSCGRHALNNMYGKEIFVKQELDASKKPIVQKIDLKSPKQPISLIDFCKKLVLESKKTGSKDNYFECRSDENYSITTLQFAIFLLGDSYDDFANNKLPEFIDHVTNKFPKDATLQILINLGTTEKSENGTKTKGEHWVSTRSTSTTHCYYDSLSDKPITFDTRDELIDYIVEKEFVHAIVLKTPRPKDPIDIIAKLKEVLGVGKSSATAETDNTKITGYLKTIKSSKEDYNTFIEFTSQYIVEPKSIGGGMSGGKYTGEQYVTSKPLSTTPVPSTPSWYEIPPKSMNNLTPLQYAIGYGSVDSVRVLIRNGGDFTASTMNGLTMENLAKARKENDMRAKDVRFLLQYIFEASGTAASDYNSKKMKDDYATEANVREEAKKYRDVLNFVYEKTYKALKKGKSTSEVLGEVGEKAKKQGKEDGLNEREDKKRSSDENPSKEDRDGYALGYKLGQAERAGKGDGLAKSPPDPNYDKDTLDTEIRNAYKDAYNKAKGKDIYRGFKDGITGKERNSGESEFLKFDNSLTSKLKFKTIDQKVIDEYDIGYDYGIQKFKREIKNIVGRAENDGRLDGYNGKDKFSTKYFINSKPLFGAILDTTSPGGYRDITEGEESETFEVDYSKLELKPIYKPISEIQLNTSKIKEVPKSPYGEIGYGSYIKSLYEYGFQTGRNDSDKKGGKTYRKKKTTQSKTYKKKLSKK